MLRTSYRTAGLVLRKSRTPVHGSVRLSSVVASPESIIEECQTLRSSVQLLNDVSCIDSYYSAPMLTTTNHYNVRINTRYRNLKGLWRRRLRRTPCFLLYSC